MQSVEVTRQDMVPMQMVALVSIVLHSPSQYDDTCSFMPAALLPRMLLTCEADVGCHCAYNNAHYFAPRR